MSNITLLRRIAIIHAIKANRTNIDSQVEESYNKQAELKSKITSALTQENLLLKEIQDWANSDPIATEREIIKVFKKI